MPALQVRDVPTRLYDELKACASANHRSMAQQTLMALELMLGHGAEQAVAEGASLASPTPSLSAEAARGSVPISPSPSSAAPNGAVGFRVGRSVPDGAAQRAARAARRARIFEECDEIAWRGNPPSTDDAVFLVNAGRRERLERVLSTLDPFADEAAAEGTPQ